MTIGGKNLFHAAVMSGKPEVVKYLLEHGADQGIMPNHTMTYQDMLICVDNKDHVQEITVLLGLEGNCT